ncbi:MAG: thiolase family protein [Myxococcales bacterium]|nr:thiolase family protein [Myxococcales bacterium]
MTRFPKSDRDAVIVAATRTPVGKQFGALQSVRPDDLAALVLNTVVERPGIDPVDVDEVILGCANQAGEDNRNIARMALLLAGFPHSVPGVTVNRLCASGLEAINQAARLIVCGEAKIVVAGGVESMSRAPWVMPKPIDQKPSGNVQMFDTALGWRFPNPRMAELFPLEAMGETAENLVEQFHISREDQDNFAAESHRRAHAAWNRSVFSDEIVNVTLAHKKGPPVVVEKDEGIRPDTSVATLASLKPAFRKNGTVTAGNSSTLNDGAAALLVMSRNEAARRNLPILATHRGGASCGVDPRVMGIGPVGAIRKLLAHNGMTTDDIDLFELNEAFAAQALAVMRQLDISMDKTNVFGGAIAIGHPLGMSGARISTTLIHELKRSNKRFGIASLCVGVGQGLATLFERE